MAHRASPLQPEACLMHTSKILLLQIFSDGSAEGPAVFS